MGKHNKGKIKSAMQINPLQKMRKDVREKLRLGQSSATAERLMKVGEDAIETLPPDGQGKVEQRINAAPLDRLWKEERISRREFDAGDKFRRDAHLARIDPGAPSVDWGSVGGSFGPRVPSMFSSQAVFEARARWREADKAIQGTARSVLRLGLELECSLEHIGRVLFRYQNERDARS